VLNQGSFQRLKDYSALAQFVRQGITLQQLVVRENQACRDLIKATRLLENLVVLLAIERLRPMKRCEIEQIHIREPPRGIFACWLRKRLELFPGRALLLPKPGGKRSRASWTGKDGPRNAFRSGFGQFIKDN
jgi:hypothetical protein